MQVTISRFSTCRFVNRNDKMSLNSSAIFSKIFHMEYVFGKEMNQAEASVGSRVKLKNIE